MGDYCAERSYFESIPMKRDFLKRIFDIFFSLFIIALTSPILLITSICIFFTSKGPIFYKQKRVTLQGKVFDCLKFRTMFKDAEKVLQKILAEDEKKRKEWEVYFKLKEDPRITPFGRFLRKTSIDELPQFFNVLRGDLSVVGPRPMPKDELFKRYGNKAAKVLSVRPGITGLWQISGRNQLSVERRVELDDHYVDNRNFFVDLIIILKTIPAIFSSRGAY